MSGSLFGTNNTVPGTSGGNRHLIEFRCGKMSLVGKMVHSDARKGLAYMYQSDDGLLHFCWKERTASGKVEDDLIIFPDDCEFKRIALCKSGRVFLLKFRSSSRKLFYWMQEPKTDKDDDNCRRVNDIMNTPNLPTTMTQVTSRATAMHNAGIGVGSGGGGGGSSSGGTGGGESSDLQALLSNMSQQQLMHLFNGVSPMGIASFLGSMRPNNSNRLNSSGSGSSARTTSTTAASNSTSTTTSSSSSTTSTATTTTSTTPGSTNSASSTTSATTTSTTTTTPVTPSNAASTNVSTPTAPRRSLRLNREDSSGSGSGGSEQTSSGSKPAQKISLTELQSFLSGIKRPSGDSVNLSGPNIDLSSAINTETMNSLFKNCDGERIRSLASHLPTLPTVVDGSGSGGGVGGTTTESSGAAGGKIENVDEAKKEIKDTILSPQFQQALSMFSSALQSGQLGPVVSQFSLSSEAIAAANAGDLEDFVKAMEKSTTQTTTSTSATKSNEKETGGTDDKKSSSTKDKKTDKSE